MADAAPELAFAQRPAAEWAAGLLVLMHGRGADERDLLGLAPQLDPERRLHVVCPRAPLALPPGGWHWYVSRRVGCPDPETFRASYQTLGSWIDRTAKALAIPWERTVLGGFSQGAVMSLGLTFGVGRPAPAGVLAFSGFLPSVPGLKLTGDGHRELSAALAHGLCDPVIEVSFARQARDWLSRSGVPLIYDESPVGHTIAPDVLDRRGRWLRELLPDRAAP